MRHVKGYRTELLFLWTVAFERWLRKLSQTNILVLVLAFSFSSPNKISYAASIQGSTSLSNVTEFEAGHCIIEFSSIEFKAVL